MKAYAPWSFSMVSSLLSPICYIVEVENIVKAKACLSIHVLDTRNLYFDHKKNKASLAIFDSHCCVCSV